ncbi:MAG: hypothetical protein ACRDT2_07845 [Natronosporangium sp.]
MAGCWPRTAAAPDVGAVAGRIASTVNASWALSGNRSRWVPGTWSK